MKYGLAVVALMTSFAYSAVPAVTDKLEVLDNFDMGLVTNVSSNKQAKNSSPKIRNMYFDKKIGSLVKSDGFVTTGATATLSDERFGITYYKPDGSTEFLVSDGSAVYTTVDHVAYTAIRTGLNRNFNPKFKQIEDKIWIGNGSDSWSVYTSTGGHKVLTFVPKGKDIEYWDGRPFVFNTPDDASALYYASLRSTDNLVVAPDDQRAWPTENLFYVGRGDGDQGTFIFDLNGTLVAGKENSMHRIVRRGLNLYDAVKFSANAGIISRDSVVESDGYGYGVGRDGIYEFTSGSMRRMTDHIQPDMDNVFVSVTRTGQFTWDLQSEFIRNASFSGTTATPAGFVTTFSSSFFLNTGLNNLDAQTLPHDPLVNALLTHNAGSSSTAYGVLIPTFTLPANYVGYVSSMVLFGGYFLGGSTTPVARITIRHAGTGRETNSIDDPFEIGGSTTVDSFRFENPSTFTFTGAEINNGSFTVKITLISGVQYAVSVPSVSQNATIIMTPVTTGSYISEISTATGINLWDKFDAVTNTNGGAVSFFYRAASSTVNIATYTWTPISPGGVINSTGGSTYIQWAATISAVSISTPADIDQVTIRYITGSGSNTRSFSSKWKGRVWIAVSTESTGNFPLIYVKAKNTNSFRDAFTVFEGIPVRSFWKNKEDIFYGGSSTAGVTLRLDYGTNYNGQAIDAYCETPDMPFGDKFFEKEAAEWMVDVDKEAGANLLLGTSVDGGSFIEQTVSLDGTGRLLKKLNWNANNIARKYFKTLKYRVRNNQLDKGLTFNALGVLYRNTLVNE